MASRSRSVRNRAALPALATALAAFAVSTSSAQLLTFSHDDFGDAQGYKGWQYGFFDGTSATPWRLDDFEPFTLFQSDRWYRAQGPDSFWTSIDRDGGHPNGIITSGGRLPENNWAVRRWTSDGTYILRVNGRLWDTNVAPGAGNGVIGSIWKDGVTLWQATLDNGNEHGFLYSLDLCVVPGTILDFAIDPRDGNDFADSTGFHTWIRTVIETQPQDSLTCTGGSAEFFVGTLPGDFTYQWRLNGVPIQHDATMPRLRVVNASPATVGVYDCIVSNDCGSMLSDPARLTICDADFDCDGFIDSRDFFTFIDAFLLSTPRSDLNHDGLFNTQDYFDFITLFFTGCPS